jgi:hypothetical protein
MQENFSPNTAFLAIVDYVAQVLSDTWQVKWSRSADDGISFPSQFDSACFETIILADGMGHRLDVMRMEIDSTYHYFIRAKAEASVIDDPHCIHGGFMMHPFDPVDHGGFCKIVKDFEYGVH